MSKNKRPKPIMPSDPRFIPPDNRVPVGVVAGDVRKVRSLFDAMIDGREFQSILNSTPPPDHDIVDEIVTGIEAIERIRGRKCLLYVGGMTRPNVEAAVNVSDDLPFAEMVDKVPATERNVDIFLSTPGGSGQQIARFVNSLRNRFDTVDFLIPSLCMSAGTLFALSGDRIYMTPRACVGPIDPQVPTKDGRFVPAQALLLLVKELQSQGQDALASGAPVPWSAVRIIDTIDKKELGDAVSASSYAMTTATDFLEKYKFRNWTIRETEGVPPTPEYKHERAVEIAQALADHGKWKSHQHSISRNVLWEEIKLKIDHPDEALERAMTRLWALMAWIFEKSGIIKAIVSTDYRYLKFVQV